MTTVEAPPIVLPDEMRAFAALADYPPFKLLREKYELMRLEEEAQVGRSLLRDSGFDREHYLKRAGFWTGVGHLFNATEAAKKQLLREQKKEQT